MSFFFDLVLECCFVVGAKASLGLAFSHVAKLFIHRSPSISRISLNVCYRIVLEIEQDADFCMDSDVLEKL